MKIIVINGPNLNMLGIREPEIYGDKTLDDLVEYIKKYCAPRDIEPYFFQSNHEGEIIDVIQDSLGEHEGIIINPAAYTHTSVAILDALKAVAIPAVEVHLTDVNGREDFRKLSYAGLACLKTYTSLGFEGYRQALLFLKAHLAEKK